MVFVLLLVANGRESAVNRALDGITNPKYKWLHFLATIFFTKRRTH